MHWIIRSSAFIAFSLTHRFPVFLPILPFFTFYASPTGLVVVSKVRGEDVSTGPGRLLLGMPVNGEHGQEGGRTLQKPWRMVQENIRVLSQKLF